MIYRTTNAFFFWALAPIGGIESHLYYIARKFGKYDVTVFFYQADEEQVKRLRKLVRCVKLLPEDKVECENMFCCFNRKVLDQTEAKKVYMVLHADYKDMIKKGQLPKYLTDYDDRVDEYLGVSEHVCEAWKDLTGLDAKYVGNPIVMDPVEKPLLLCSATRLTSEKGWGRMRQLADMMNQAGINFMWFIYTNDPKDPVKNMVFLKPRLDIVDSLSAFDAFVQLSDSEGYCLSVVEALMRGVPVIGTDLPVFHEIGMNEENSILLPLDMSDVPLEKIKHVRDMRFKFKQPKDNWSRYIKKVKSNYDPSETGLRKMIATGGWERLNVMDRETELVPHEGEVLWLTAERLERIREFEQKRHVSMVKEETDV